MKLETARQSKLEDLHTLWIEPMEGHYMDLERHLMGIGIDCQVLLINGLWAITHLISQADELRMAIEPQPALS